MILRFLTFLGIRHDVVDMVHMPVDRWHALIDERNALRRRVRDLEAAFAAVEQGR